LFRVKTSRGLVLKQHISRGKKKLLKDDLVKRGKTAGRNGWCLKWGENEISVLCFDRQKSGQEGADGQGKRRREERETGKRDRKGEMTQY
jgi:hypothetical protein